MMSAIKGADTHPEMQVRRYLHAAGLRFRIQDRRLPGRPDLVLPKYKVAVFVHGCFWHRHAGCRYATTPSTNPDFWAAKFAANQRRDRLVWDQVLAMGWTPIEVWECETRELECLDALFLEIVANEKQYLPSTNKKP